MSTHTQKQRTWGARSISSESKVSQFGSDAAGVGAPAGQASEDLR